MSVGTAVAAPHYCTPDCVVVTCAIEDPNAKAKALHAFKILCPNGFTVLDVTLLVRVKGKKSTNCAVVVNYRKDIGMIQFSYDNSKPDITLLCRQLPTTIEHKNGHSFSINPSCYSIEFNIKCYCNHPFRSKMTKSAVAVLTAQKEMSTYTMKLPLNIEYFMDVDVHSSMARSQMEELCAHVLQRTEHTFKKCLLDSRLSPDDIYAVEVVGGSTRIPAVKALIEQIFNKQVCTTLKAVSRGAALQCVFLSPKVRSGEFSIVDIQNYQLKINWDGESGQSGEMEAFPTFHAAPFSRLLTLFQREPFNMKFTYADPSTFPYPVCGRWHVKDVKPNAAGVSQEVKVKVRIDYNGILFISSASMVEKREAEVKNGANEQLDTSGEQMDCQEGTTDDNNSKEKKKKPTQKTIELTLESKTHGFSPEEIKIYHVEESGMIENDREEKERVDARNALEEFIYDMRDKLAEEGPLSAYVVDGDRKTICGQLNELENCNRDTLQGLTDPIKARSLEYEYQPRDFDDLGHDGATKYNHLTETEISIRIG